METGDAARNSDAAAAETLQPLVSVGHAWAIAFAPMELRRTFVFFCASPAWGIGI